MALHTILGANGTIATELLPILLENNEQVRLVSRNPKPATGTETVAADVLNHEQVMNAVQGSSIVYLLIGIEYDTRKWHTNWPIIMRNVIDACKAANATLVFFDNIYMYGKVKGRITEETPFNPMSKKGEVRATIDNMLLDEMKNGTLKAIIAKATDFYGPRAKDKSVAGVTVFERLKKGLTAQWFVNANVPRSFNYTPDAAKALYILAKSEKAVGQSWHLPSPLPAPTGKEFVKMAAKYMNVPEKANKVQVLPKFMFAILGLANRFMKEMHEMMYQNEAALEFDSGKFEKAFNFKPTSYEEGIKKTAEWFLQENK